MAPTMFGESVRVTTPDQVHSFIMARASGMIWASCYLPLITLLVTSLGVVNTVMASVRARRWEFGVLRSQGITRSGLFRMILAEGLLIGLITCLLSLGFGVFSGWCGTGISQYVSFFGGLPPPLVIPWGATVDRVRYGLAQACWRPCGRPFPLDWQSPSSSSRRGGPPCDNNRPPRTFISIRGDTTKGESEMSKFHGRGLTSPAELFVSRGPGERARIVARASIPVRRGGRARCSAWARRLEAGPYLGVVAHGGVRHHAPLFELALYWG